GRVDAKGAARREGGEHPRGTTGMEEDRVETHAARARLPHRRRLVTPEAGKLLPGLPAVRRAEQGGVLHARVDGVRIVKRRLEMPDAREVPGMRRAVVPEVRAGHALVDELVADRLPGLAAVARALDDLSEPAARLRRVQSVRVGRRSLHVIDLPAAEVRAADVPLLAPAVRGHDERALARTYQH